MDLCNLWEMWYNPHHMPLKIAFHKDGTCLEEHIRVDFVPQEAVKAGSGRGKVNESHLGFEL